MKILTTETVPSYVASKLHLAEYLGDIRSVELSEEGKINGVFFVHGTKSSLTLKQGLPWVRVLPNWDLSVERIAWEAHVLSTWAGFQPEAVPRLHGFDDEDKILAMEYLANHTLLRDHLKSHAPNGAIGKNVGRMLARAAIETSPLTMSGTAYREAIAASQNPAMSALMEDVVFTIPFSDSDKNIDIPYVAEFRRELLRDTDALRAVAELRWIFTTSQESLIHGDFHAGSLLVHHDDVRAIDAEFGRYGPIAWDIGEFWAHVAIAALIHEGLGRVDRAREVLQLVDDSWNEFRSEINASLASAPSPTFAATVADGWLGQVQKLAVRFSGVEVLRRIIGVGECEQLIGLPNEKKRNITERILAKARAALVGASPLGLIDGTGVDRAG